MCTGHQRGVARKQAPLPVVAVPVHLHVDVFVLLCWFYWTGHGVEKFPVKVQVGTITVAYVVEYSLARKGANEDGAVTFLVQRGRAALHRFSVKRVSAI